MSGISSSGPCLCSFIKTFQKQKDKIPHERINSKMTVHKILKVRTWTNRSNFHVPRTACLKFAVKNYLLVKENTKICRYWNKIYTYLITGNILVNNTVLDGFFINSKMVAESCLQHLLDITRKFQVKLLLISYKMHVASGSCQKSLNIFICV